MARVLVISPNEMMRYFLEIILESAGHQVSVLENDVGIETVPQREVNAVLLDLNTPGAEPPSSLAAVRTRLPRVPIVAIAGTDQRLDFLEVRMSGADDVLRYPVLPRALLEAVERAIQEEL
jgi:CheY-like chemotaxis protein